MKPRLGSLTVTTAASTTTSSSSSPTDWPAEKIYSAELFALATGPAVWYERELKNWSLVWCFKKYEAFLSLGSSYWTSAPGARGKAKGPFSFFVFHASLVRILCKSHSNTRVHRCGSQPSKRPTGRYKVSGPLSGWRPRELIMRVVK